MACWSAGIDPSRQAWTMSVNHAPRSAIVQPENRSSERVSAA